MKKIDSLKILSNIKESNKIQIPSNLSDISKKMILFSSFKNSIEKMKEKITEEEFYNLSNEMQIVRESICDDMEDSVEKLNFV